MCGECRYNEDIINTVTATHAFISNYIANNSKSRSTHRPQAILAGLKVIRCSMAIEFEYY